MDQLWLQPVDRPEVPPRRISARLRTQLVYFSGPPEAPEASGLGENEYYLPAAEVERVLDEGVIYLVSPLDTAHKTEVEIEEEQEALLHWLKTHGIQHVRVVG